MRSTSRKFVVGALAIALAIAAIILTSYRRDLTKARQRIAEQSQIAPTRCGPIEYAIRGAGPPVLVVHGAGGGFDQGLLMSQRLAEQGFRTIGVSRFGYLGTPMPRDASPEAQADAHVCLLDALKVDQVAVLGASAGAPSSLQLAIRHPERVNALIVLVPAIYMPGAGGAGTRVPKGLETIINTALKWDLPFWLASHMARRSMIRIMLGTPTELVANANARDQAEVDVMLGSILPVRDRRLGLLNETQVTTSLPRYALEEIRVPTLLVSAQDDLYGTYERARYTAGQIPGARFVGYPTGGHLLVGRTDALTAEMVTLLRAGQNQQRERRE
jgi:2-hydroxy-6-oxonona-2,4-dienedioate hydrolase